jgi:hypothetical protein
MEKLLLALFKAVMDTSNDPLAIVPAVLAVMLMDDGNTKVKSVPRVAVDSRSMGSPIFDIINVGPFVWFSSTSIVAFRVEPKHTVRDDGSRLSDTSLTPCDKPNSPENNRHTNRRNIM